MNLLLAAVIIVIVLVLALDTAVYAAINFNFNLTKLEEDTNRTIESYRRLGEKQRAERVANEKLKEDVYVQGTAIKLFGVVGAVVLVGVTMLLVRRWRNAPQQAVELRLPPLPR
jgi:predicted PurR-regulated permease PerM